MKVLILCFAVSSLANCSRRSCRRAVRTRFTPPAANSFARATPIPALAPVINAHFPRHSAVILFASFSWPDGTHKGYVSSPVYLDPLENAGDTTQKLVRGAV